MRYATSQSATNDVVAIVTGPGARGTELTCAVSHGSYSDHQQPVRLMQVGRLARQRDSTAGSLAFDIATPLSRYSRKLPLAARSARGPGPWA